MQNQLSGLLFILVIVLILFTVVAIFYLYLTARNKERMALIERGMNPNLAGSTFWVQIGIIAGGIALGLICGDFFPGKFGPLIAILFAGGGLVIYNAFLRGKMRS